MKPDVIVIGGSAGSIEALRCIIHSLPADLPAAVFVVVHRPPWQGSDLCAIISCHGVQASHARSGDSIQHGRIYVAPPDNHLLMQYNHVQLWRGPKENRHRPSINATFRSASVTFKRRVIGVILSGALDDGATGLWWIKQFGGVAVVQDPKDATHPDMPRSAIQHVQVDHVVSANVIGPLLVSLTSEAKGEKEPTEVARGI